MGSTTAARVVTAVILAIALSLATAASASAARVLSMTPAGAGSFGTVNVGDNSAPQSFKLTIECTGGMPFCTESFSPTPASGSLEFPVLNLCPPTITGSIGIFGTNNQICFIVATFVPNGAGPRTATLTTGSGGPTATLTGTGVAPAATTQATAGKCKKGGKKKGRAAKKCKRKKKR